MFPSRAAKLKILRSGCATKPVHEARRSVIYEYEVTPIYVKSPAIGSFFVS